MDPGTGGEGGGTPGPSVAPPSSDPAVQASRDLLCRRGNLCDGTTGLCRPATACSGGAACSSSAGIIATPFPMPVCRTSVEGRLPFDDGAPRAWLDENTAEQRAACVYKPPGTSDSSPRPLVVFVHGSRGAASDIYDYTSLRAKAESFDLSGDAARPGFVLAADQGRTLSDVSGYTDPGPRHDFFFRDPGVPSRNPDVRSLDALIDGLVAEGGIDPARIYVAGWSGGAMFAEAYAIARHDTATPGGSRVAAAAGYAGGDPFADLAPDGPGTCQLQTYPQSTVPLYLVQRACDALVACDAEQRERFELPLSSDFSSWLEKLRSAIGDPNVVDRIIDARGARFKRARLPGFVWPASAW